MSFFSESHGFFLVTHSSFSFWLSEFWECCSGPQSLFYIFERTSLYVEKLLEPEPVSKGKSSHVYSSSSSRVSSPFVVGFWGSRFWKPSRALKFIAFMISYVITIDILGYQLC